MFWTINELKSLPGFRVVTSLESINGRSIQTLPLSFVMLLIHRKGVFVERDTATYTHSCPNLEHSKMLQKALSRNFHEIIKESPWPKVKPHWSFIYEKEKAQSVHIKTNNTAIFENSARGKLYFPVRSWWPETSNQPSDEFIIPFWVADSHINLKKCDI